MVSFDGALTALVTPLRDDGVDEEALRDLVERQIAGGIDGLVPCGTTGESVTMREGEHARVVGIVVDQAKGRVPVVAGAGASCTARTIALSEASREAGADGLLLACPAYNKPTQAGLEAHFRAVLERVPMPTVLYNVPGRTSVDLLPETLARLADVSAIVGIKEATGSVARAQEILALCGDRFAVLSGDDALTLPLTAVGGKGVISVASNLCPAEMAHLVALVRDGDLPGARAISDRLLPLFGAMFFEANPGPIKYALARAGHIQPEIRLPLVWPLEQTQARLDAVIDRAGVAS